MTNYREQMMDFVKNGLYSAISMDENQTLLEDFFHFTDYLEQISDADLEAKKVLIDCLIQVGHISKARELFSEIYDPKNRKDLKRLYELEKSRDFCVIRPSERCDFLPDFRYASTKMVRRKFFQSKGCQCKLCQMTNVPFYGGEAFTSNDDIIVLNNQKEHYCLECLRDGSIAKALDIHFNSTYLEGCKSMSKEQRHEIVKCTPAFDLQFWKLDEEGWPGCCNDFACFEDEDCSCFYFRCRKCGKQIMLKKD